MIVSSEANFSSSLRKLLRFLRRQKKKSNVNIKILKMPASSDCLKLPLNIFVSSCLFLKDTNTSDHLCRYEKADTTKWTLTKRIQQIYLAMAPFFAVLMFSLLQFDIPLFCCKTSKSLSVTEKNYNVTSILRIQRHRI